MFKQKFSKSFDDVLQQAYIFQSQFVDDQADFTAFSAQFMTPFETNFLTDIQTADAIPTYENDLNHQQILTVAVEEKMEECRVHFQKLMTYVRMVWPNSVPIHIEFGSKSYEKARYSDKLLMNLLQDAEVTANLTKYNADLVAAGFLQTDIDLLGTLATELTEANRVQERYKANSMERTEDRIEAFNKVWDTMVKLSNVSKSIYADSPGKLESYYLYPDSPTPNPPAAPQNLTFLPTSFMFSWDPSPTATSYQLQFKLTVNNDWIDAYTGSATSFNFNPGDGIWQFRVRGRNAGGYGNWSDIIVIQLPTTLDPPYNVSVMHDPDPTPHNVITFSISPEATSVDVYVSIVPLGGDEGMYNFEGNFSPVSPIERNVGTGLRFWYYLIARDGTETSLESTHVYVDVN